MKKLTFFLFMVLAVISCKKDKGVAKGAIFVKVEMSSGTVVPNAQISTSPTTKSGKTDATGSLLMNDIPVGIYEVTATQSGFGSGVGSVSVKDGDVSDVTIKLVAGTYVGPTVQISQPYGGPLYAGDEIVFVAYASHSEQSPAELTVEWSSSVDGVLNTDSPNSNGKIGFATSALSVGPHTITVKVTDNQSKTAEAHKELNIIKRPDPVVLNEVEVLNDGLSLSWSASTDDHFKFYRIIRSTNQNGYSYIAEITDKNSTTFIDDDYLEFGKTYYYRVEVVVESSASAESNVQEVIFEFENIDVGVSITRMMVDPSRAYVYALDKDNNELLFINTDSKQVEKSIFVGSNPSGMDMNADYSKLYVANNGSSLVSVVDLNTQTKVNDLQVETQSGWDNNPFSIVWLKGGYIAYSVEGYGKIRIANAQTGALVNNNVSDYGKYLDTNKAHDKLFSSFDEGVKMYGFNAGMLTEIGSTGNYGSFDKKIFVTSDDAYVFIGLRKFSTNNLGVLLGTFDEEISAINSDGSIATGRTKIYNGNTFSVVAAFPFYSLVKAIDSDSKMLYSFNGLTKKIYLTKLD